MDNKKNVRFSGMGIYMIIVIIAAMFIMYVARMNTGTSNYTYNELVNDISKGKIESVSIRQNAEVPTGVVAVKVSGEQSVKSVYVSDVKDVEELLLDKNIEYTLKDVARQSVMLTTILPFGLSLLVIVFIMMMFTRQAGGGGNAKMMNFGKSRARMISSADNKVTFKDVAGLQEEKEELEEIVDFLKDPVRYTSLGARIPKGVILTGAPGTGKTLLAKAVAGEASVPFFSISGSDFVEMFVGVGASRVRDLFEEGKKNAPCIIFIDEIDAIGKSRDSRYGGGNDEREQTLNALLAEMDGFDSSKGLVILAATNRPEVLDKALLRPGRFDRRVIVERPDLKGRVETLKVHAKNVKMDETVNFDEIALATSGAVGSDLANMINEAALAAVKAGREAVSQKDLLEAVEVVIAGKEKKDRILGEEEKKIVAYHEVGHAMAIAVQKNTEPVQKITIVPRTMGALGYTMQVPEEEKYLMSKEQMLGELVTLFGGRAAEEVVFHSVTTGASNDIERATQIARAMVTQYGMSEKFGLMGLESIQNRYLDGRAVMNCSDATGALIDEEVKEMLKVAYDQAKKIIEDHREVMDEIAEFLIERETITGKEFMEIYNKSLKKDEPESVEEDKEKTELSEVETVSEESSLKDAESQDAQKVTEKKDSEEVKQEE